MTESSFNIYSCIFFMSSISSPLNSLFISLPFLPVFLLYFLIMLPKISLQINSLCPHPSCVSFGRIQNETVTSRYSSLRSSEGNPCTEIPLLMNSTWWWWQRWALGTDRRWAGVEQKWINRDFCAGPVPQTQHSNEQGTQVQSLVRETRSHMSLLKTLHATTKTWHSQINNF